MLFKVICILFIINKISSEGIVNTDGGNRFRTQNAQISDAGKHILAKITEARQADKKYDHLTVHNMNVTEAMKHVDDIVKLFMECTEGFDSQSCLTIEEKDMGRTVDDNCYAQISNRIVQTIAGKYELTVGEKAYMVTDSVTNDEIKYEFFLGPLYFGVYHTKP